MRLMSETVHTLPLMGKRPAGVMTLVWVMAMSPMVTRVGSLGRNGTPGSVGRYPPVAS